MNLFSDSFSLSLSIFSFLFLLSLLLLYICNVVSSFLSRFLAEFIHKFWTERELIRFHGQLLLDLWIGVWYGWDGEYTIYVDWISDLDFLLASRRGRYSVQSSRRNLMAVRGLFIVTLKNFDIKVSLVILEGHESLWLRTRNLRRFWDNGENFRNSAIILIVSAYGHRGNIFEWDIMKSRIAL